MNQVLSFLERKRNFNIERFPKKFGLACSIEYCIVIIVYNWSSSLPSSSKDIEKKDTPGQNPFDISIRTIIAFYHIIKLGQDIVGQKHFVKLCMSMFPLVNVKAFNSMQSKIADAYVNISKVSMTEAAEDLRLNSIHAILKT